MLGLGTGFYGLGKTRAVDQAVFSSDDFQANYLIVPSYGDYAGGEAPSYGYGLSGLVLPVSFESTIKSSFTFCTWHASSQTGSTQVLLGSNGGEHSSGVGNDYLTIGIIGGKGFVRLKTGEESNDFLQSTATGLHVNDNNWHHIAFVITDVGDSSDTTLKVYFDGAAVTMATPISTMTGSEQGEFITENQLGIGCSVTAAAPGLPVGNSLQKMAGCALFNIALDLPNINAIYNMGYLGVELPDLTSASGHYDKTSALAGYWKCNDGTLTPSHTAVDSSTNSNNGETAGAAVLI